MTYGGYVALRHGAGRGRDGPPPAVADDRRQPADDQLQRRPLRRRGGARRRPRRRSRTASRADEDGGIYVVTSKRMRRVDHDARRNRLTSTWSAPYNAGTGQSPIRLGRGSGSTPTVMGVGRRTSSSSSPTARDLMHLNLFWRERIPRYWRGLGGGRPRRMACDYPVRFGDPNARFSLSEQSVNVRGYASFVVNNLPELRLHRLAGGRCVRNALAALRGGDPGGARTAPSGSTGTRGRGAVAAAGRTRSSRSPTRSRR